MLKGGCSIGLVRFPLRTPCTVPGLHFDVEKRFCILEIVKADLKGKSFVQNREPLLKYHQFRQQIEFSVRQRDTVDDFQHGFLLRHCDTVARHLR